MNNETEEAKTIEIQEVNPEITPKRKNYLWHFCFAISLLGLVFSTYNYLVITNKINAITGNQPKVLGQTLPSSKDFVKELTGNEPTLGDPNAPVTIIEFADFQCPFCKQFFSGPFPDLKKNYIDSGKVNFIFYDIAFLGPESTDAGVAAFCAGEQGKYWEYHDLLYQNQSGENLGKFKYENLENWAGKLNLNISDFKTCMQSDKYDNLISQQTSTAEKYNANGTPTFFIQDKIFRGVQTYQTFQNTIDSALQN